MIRIDGKRLLADLRELAGIGAYKTGVDRIALSAADIEARRWLVGKLAAAGLQASMDRIGNVRGRDPRAKRAILIGSHTDTVPRGGWLDGALGVGYALEIARSAIAADEAHAVGVDVISFEDEEGTYLPFLGSRSYFSELDDAEVAAARSKDGASLAVALATIADEPPPLRFDAQREICYIESHIEQGPRMEAGGNRIAVVTGLVGIRRFRLRSHGAANHAGTTPMAMRKDAGAALIALAAALGADMRALAGPETVWNIGNMVFRPGAANVVPGEGEMLFEFRDLDGAALDRLQERFVARVAEANRGPVKIEVEPTANLAPTPLAQDLGAAISAAAIARGETPVALPSGAGHDAMVVARHMPAAMMFIPSIGGISHDITENTSDEDIVFGCEVLADAVSRLRGEA
ncbi:MAG TPA: hydantoinase/carbamoylase family amidase [Xanthobacteraceae bacterium]|jgi:N-carbamoyl-L-amino-acid hydrolase|nr:hydantoinase/carbamoylase family amidase [Xanthobacteraceae bacterium]